MTFDFLHRSGPCIICGDTNYSLSCGGSSICPKCDCGNFDAATVEKQAKVIAELRGELERARGLLTLVLHTESNDVQPEYLSGCQLRGPGECGRIGMCQNQSCKNAGKVIVKRVCVEPKEAGIVYPKVET